MIIRCKCGRNTTFGLTCTACRSTVFVSDKYEKEEPEFDEPGFHVVELDDDFNEILDDED